MFGYIYETINLINGKKYIGKRQKQVFDPNYKGSGKYLWHAIHKYGWDNFEVILLFKCNSKEELIFKEIETISDYRELDIELYNIAKGGEGGIGIPKGHQWSEEYIRNRAELLRTKYKGSGNPFHNKKHSKETRERMKDSHIGVKLCSETINKMKVNNSGEGNPFYGKKHSDEVRKIISFKKKGRININNGLVVKVIYPDKLEEFISKGWIKGGLKKA